MSKLYNNILSLCENKGITGYRMCKEIGIQPSILTDLKMGRKEGLSSKNADKIARYFGVSVGYLLGPDYSEVDETKKSPSVSDEDIKFALFGGEGEITDEMWQAVKEYAEFIKDKHGKK